MQEADMVKMKAKLDDQDLLGSGHEKISREFAGVANRSLPRTGDSSLDAVSIVADARRQQTDFDDVNGVASLGAWSAFRNTPRFQVPMLHLKVLKRPKN